MDCHVPCTIYFAKPIGSDGPIKIGATKNVEKRIRSLSYQSGRKMELITSLEASFATERWLHNALKDSTLSGEWYHRTEQIDNIIERVKAGGYVMERHRMMPGDTVTCLSVRKRR